MSLEQMLKFAPKIEQTRMYKTIDVYAIGTTALYTPPLKPSRTIGPLVIRSFPASGFQLHIHEQPGGIAHIKYPDGTYTEMNSYEAAMADLLADALKIKKDLKK